MKISNASLALRNIGFAFILGTAIVYSQRVHAESDTEKYAGSVKELDDAKKSLNKMINYLSEPGDKGSSGQEFIWYAYAKMNEAMLKELKRKHWNKDDNADMKTLAYLIDMSKFSMENEIINVLLDYLWLQQFSTDCTTPRPAKDKNFPENSRPAAYVLQRKNPREVRDAVMEYVKNRKLKALKDEDERLALGRVWLFAVAERPLHIDMEKESFKPLNLAVKPIQDEQSRCDMKTEKGREMYQLLEEFVVLIRYTPYPENPDHHVITPPDEKP